MHFIVSVLPTWGYAVLQALLGLLGVTGSVGLPLLTTPSLRLIKGGPGAIIPTWDPSDFTEADFVGYASQTIVLGTAPVNNPNGNGVGIMHNSTFTCTTAPASPGQSILGYWLQGSSGEPIIAELFAAPIPIVNAGDFINLSVFIPLNFQNAVGV